MELIIDGIRAELGNSIPALTRKSIDINNPAARHIDISNRFQLPDTAINRTIFDSPAGVGTNNRSFDKLYRVELNDATKLFSGYGFLTSSKKNTFDFQLVDRSKDIFNALNVKLNTVLWDDNDTILTQAAIDAQRTHDIDNCWIWGRMCCHRKPSIINTDQTTGDARTKYSRPQFNVNALLKRVIEANGFTFTPPDENLAISSNHKQFFFTDYQKTFNQTFTVSGSQAITGFDTYDFKEASVTAVSGSVKGLSKHNYRIRGNFTASEGMYMVIYSIDSSGTKPIYNTVTFPESGYLDYVTSEIYDGPTGMTTTFTIYGTGSVTFTDVLIYKIVDEKNEDLSTNHFLDHYIKVYDNLPDDLTYMDLVRLICVLFNKYPVVNSYEKTFGFDTLANINKMNSVDWSEKFIIGSETISTNFRKLAQKNILRYENDITVQYNHGEDWFLTDNESLVNENDYIVVPFGSTIDVIVSTNTIAHAEIYDDTQRIVDREVNKRVYVISGYDLVFESLHWHELLEYYYQNWFNSLYRVRAITAQFNLTKMDVLRWHPKQLVYIDYFKTTFIVLEISNFINRKPTTVKLLAYGR